jgi:hypothetical protein
LLDKGTGPWLQRLGALRRDVLAVHPAGEKRNSLLRALATRDVCDSPTCPSRAMVLEAPRKEQGSDRGSWWLT